MVKYRCSHCQDVEVKGSSCPHCGKRTYPVLSEIFWCSHCQIPSYEPVCGLCGTEGNRISADLRPVFPEERILLETILSLQTAKEVSLKGRHIWNGSGNIYYGDGRRMDIKISSLKELAILQVQQGYQERCCKLLEYQQDFEQDTEKFLQANAGHLHQIEQEAINYIRQIGEKYDIADMMISFSGGKDSTVVADLVNRTLGDGEKKILHIFGDTTLEFPSTYEYVERYKKTHFKTPVISSRNKEKDFLKLCRQIGPPSRVMRWCCTIFKTGAITRKIEKVFKNKKHIITFYGIRRSESASRSKYEKEASSPKITKQTVVSPVIDWYDFDIWLYILERKLDFNAAYRLGYARVGCFCCPNNSLWSEFLSKVHMPKEYGEFRDTIVEFAKRIGKPDPEEYVDGGNWKARQGGNGVDMANRSIISFTPCATEENTFYYELLRPISEELYELFKPFGRLDFTLGNERLGEVYVLDQKGKILIKLQGRMGKFSLKVTIYDKNLAGAKSLKVAEERIKCQITKYQMCMACLACEGVCKRDAISVKERQGKVHYTISQEKCVCCGECIAHFIAGCYMRKVLAIKR
ncbi:MAG: phosphoadenosine phosphosulfate reductase family protein [Lachnospiraceae bacterium]|nr:phosphoadenosine phosphosulfate reductase family protein [Lachnospiraceae bacterium]